jgi:hypothetical protein
MQTIPGIKKTTVMLTTEQNEWAVAQAKRLSLKGGLGAFIRYLLTLDKENVKKYGR